VPQPAAESAVTALWASAQPGELPPRAAAPPVSESRLQPTASGDLLARVFLIGLYVLLTKNLLTDFLLTGRFTGLLLLISELLVLVFTLLRRRAQTVDRSVMSVLVTTVSVAGSSLVRAAEGPGLLPDMVTTVASGVGLLIVIGAKFTLGRSFGIIPANRGIVAAGMYRFVRHPIYAGYVLTHFAFALAHPIPRNILLLAVADAALIVRALREERLLAGDAEYQSYCRRVAWHLVPGIF
jgi:protein-S-isoprenylcysteine O-methyltransferase Ste14